MSDEVNQLLEEYAKLAFLLAVSLITVLILIYLKLAPTTNDISISSELNLLLNTIVQGISVLATYIISYVTFNGIRRLKRTIERNQTAKVTQSNTNEVVTPKSSGKQEETQQIIYSVFVNLINKLPEKTLTAEECNEINAQIRFLSEQGGVNLVHYNDLGRLLIKKSSD